MGYVYVVFRMNGGGDGLGVQHLGAFTHLSAAKARAQEEEDAVMEWETDSIDTGPWSAVPSHPTAWESYGIVRLELVGTE